MIQDTEIQITHNHIGMRLDHFLTHYAPNTTRSLALTAIRNDNIHVNNRRKPKGYKLQHNDIVLIKQLREKTDIIVHPNPEIPLMLLYEDPSILALNKPAGIPVHPLKTEETNTLANGLIANYPELSSIGEHPLFPAMVHRIDTDTSGIVLVARTGSVYRTLREQFQAREVKKTYRALVHGIVNENNMVSGYLCHSSKKGKRMQMVPDESTQRRNNLFFAETRYHIEQQFDGYSLLKVIIYTGVTHQIRCQLAHIGHPILGDTLYAPPTLPTLSRHMLHASEISFQHPESGTMLHIEAPIPEDMKHVMKNSIDKRLNYSATVKSLPNK